VIRKKIKKFRHTTHDCPICRAKSEVIADPNRNTWRCFNCGASGSFAITWNVSEAGLPKEEK
jgi:ribosomal protein L37AE/L43A